MKTVCLILSILSFGRCMIFNNNPCALVPSYHAGIPADANWTATIMVPVSCTNGTFRWDYPKGHAILHFKDYGKTTSLCFSESLGGDIFTITDKNNHMQLNQLNRGSSAQVCTADSASGQPFVIQVDAPDTMYYMGEFAYEVKFV
ncbi:uncharacterized protein LOC128207381 [Mya arenaria]|uniref:uncharacterized protein LOC128207381 n=1 Tax=Mya arenaria TaxID=6604 RepID=UPI0022E8D0D5|nr:uncharacterized protein LOC128207381 [Mya arenaria]